MIAILKKDETIDDVVTVLQDHLKEALESKTNRVITRRRAKLLKETLAYKKRLEATNE